MVMRRLLAIVFAASLTFAASAQAKPGDAEKGEAVYLKRCVMCHGEDGDGDGPAAERLNPTPRDFTSGLYKIKTSAFEEDYANDDDVFRMIRDGMPGTAMPGWGDMLSEQDMWDLVAYLNVFAEIEEAPEAQIDYGNQVESSPDSIAKGDKLFHDGDRCSECHGKSGRGVAIKKLKDDNGFRTWPRNLTKPWTFRASNSPKDIYSRIATGIPGTQMPSFADPKSTKKLSIEERWHVANYVASLGSNGKAVDSAKTVIKAVKAEGGVPTATDDAKWQTAGVSTFYLVPQIIAEERFFTPSNDTISVRALYDDKNIAMLLEWDDRTKSIPGDADAAKIAEDELNEDAVAVQFPAAIPEGMEKPYFVFGDANHPVNIWKWSSGTTDDAETVSLMDATGIENQEERNAAASGLTAKAAYTDGTWRVVMTRPLATEAADQDLQFKEGRFVPVAFFAWDGSNAEADTSHTLTTWYWLLLEPPSSLTPYIVGLVIALLILLGEVWWARGGAAKRRAPEEA